MTRAIELQLLQCDHCGILTDHLSRCMDCWRDEEPSDLCDDCRAEHEQAQTYQAEWSRVEFE